MVIKKSYVPTNYKNEEVTSKRSEEYRKNSNKTKKMNEIFRRKK